jgi:hypothetical protein
MDILTTIALVTLICFGIVVVLFVLWEITFWFCALGQSMINRHERTFNRINAERLRRF